MLFLYYSLVVLWILPPELKAFPLMSCTDDQYKRILHNGSAVCVNCPACPPGLGPSMECGSTISQDTKIECQPCRAGVNFSSFYDLEQCQSCSVCSKDQVSKPCTPDSDTECEKRCMSKDKYYEKTSDDCQDCTWCCGDGKDIVIDECLRKGMPAQKSCTVHRKKLCKPPRPTTAPQTTLQTTTTATAKPTNKKTSVQSIKDKWNSREPQKKPSNNTSHLNNSNSSAVKSSSTVEMEVFIGVLCGLGSLFIAATLVWLLMKYHKRCMKRQCKLRVFYTKLSKEEHYNIINTYKEERLFDLLDAHPKLKEEVCDKLDLDKSYGKLARRCNIEEDKVKKVEENPGREPTCEIFGFIRCEKPSFSVGEFAYILKEIKKIDVLECCAKKLQELHENSKKSTTV